MSNTQIDRLKLAISKIKSGDKQISQRQMMADLQYKRESTISDILNGRAPLNDKFISRFCMKYGVSQKWIETGDGPMFQGAEIAESEPTEQENAPTESVEAINKKYVAVLEDYHEDRKLLRQTASKSLETMELVTVSLLEMKKQQQDDYAQLRATQAILIGVAAKVEKTTPEDIAFRMDKIAGQVGAQKTKSKKEPVGNLNRAFNT